MLKLSNMNSFSLSTMPGANEMYSEFTWPGNSDEESKQMKAAWESKFDAYHVGQEIIIDGRTATIEIDRESNTWYTRVRGKDNSWAYLVWVKHFSSRRGYSWVNISDITTPWKAETAMAQSIDSLPKTGNDLIDLTFANAYKRMQKAKAMPASSEKGELMQRVFIGFSAADQIALAREMDSGPEFWENYKKVRTEMYKRLSE